MLNIKRTTGFITIWLALGLGGVLLGMQGAQATVTPSTQQGMRQWQANDGKLILIAGTYQDTMTYKRSLTFYFEDKPGGEWSHVPIIEGKNDHTFTWFTISSGETTVADAVVTMQDKDIYLVKADKNPAKEETVVTWFQFWRTGDDFPDGPAYVFKPISTKIYSKNQNLSVEQILKKEVAFKAKK